MSIIFSVLSFFFSLLFVKSFNFSKWLPPDSFKKNCLGILIIFNSWCFAIDGTTDFAIDDLVVQQSLTVEGCVSFWSHEVTTLSSLVISFYYFT